MNAKAKGTRNEHRSMAIFEAAGYQTMRSAASEGPFDYHAWNGVHGVYVQVKTGRWPGSVEMEVLKACQVPPGSVKLVHRWMPRRRLPDIKEV